MLEEILAVLVKEYGYTRVKFHLAEHRVQDVDQVLELAVKETDFIERIKVVRAHLLLDLRDAKRFVERNFVDNGRGDLIYMTQADPIDEPLTSVQMSGGDDHLRR